VARYLIDTNVLVYGFDGADAAKQARALDVVARLARPNARGAPAVLPAQVLAEFARVGMNKLVPALSADEVYGQIELYARVFPVLPLTPGVVLEAVRGVRDHSLAYFDAQIWAVAKLNQVPTVLSEDFTPGATVEGVTFADPFSATFDPDTL
jgi:predicted nucleic acid-binding protein